MATFSNGDYRFGDPDARVLPKYEVNCALYETVGVYLVASLCEECVLEAVADIESN